VRARFGPREAILAAPADGPRKARRRAAEICDAYPIGGIVGAGIAGALSAELSTGDLIVSSGVRDGAGPAPPPHGALFERALSAPGVRAATLVTVERPAVSPEEKRALAAPDAGAPSAVDMESGAWAREASGRGIPYVILRAIGDEAEERLPGYLSECMDEEGGLRRSAVVAQALAHPGSIPTLLRLRRRMREASARLAALVEWLISGSG
jgi:nucleoside phosphorylase